MVLSFCRYRGFILVLTFLFYTAYHLSRKPISIVKVRNALIPVYLQDLLGFGGIRRDLQRHTASMLCADVLTRLSQTIRYLFADILIEVQF